MSFFVTGTDTDVGKSVACAWLLRRLDGCYWKPIQAGLDDVTDPQSVKHYSGLDDDRFFPSLWDLPEPLSPHEAAKRAGVTIALDDFTLPSSTRPLIVEGAGGVMVPINDTEMVRDLILHLDLPVIVVARSGLGTINHTLLTLMCLRESGANVAGIVMNGERSPHNFEALKTFGQVPIIAEIPPLETVTPDAFQSVHEHIAPHTLLSSHS